MQKIHPLRAIREAHNLTREQLAQEMVARGIGIGSATIKRAERGESIGPDSRRRLCEFFGCSSKELGFAFPDDLARLNDGEGAERNTMQSATYDALAQYIQQQRLRLFQSMAPGATALRVGEIIEHGSLFIPPPWKLLHGPTASQNLTDYLMELLRHAVIQQLKVGRSQAVDNLSRWHLDQCWDQHFRGLYPNRGFR